MTEVNDILFVAGAGTGKTYTLVERFAEALTRADLERDELVLVTFTEKAAQELQERLLGKFKDNPPVMSWLEEHPASTLHAFARRLLGRFPTRAGINPGFDVIQGSAEENLRDRTFEAFLANVADETPEDLQTLLEVGVGPGNLKNAFYELLPHAELAGSAPETQFDSHGVWKQATLEIRKWVQKASLAAAECEPKEVRKKKNQAFVAAVPALVGHAEELAKMLEHSPLEALRILSSLAEDSPPLPSNPVLKECAAELRRLCQTVRETLEEMLSEPFGRLLSDFYTLYEAEKARLAVLSFNDMVRKACGLLEQNEDLRLELVRRTKGIFVDEFQDTDPVLMKLVHLLGYSDLQQPASEGRLFLVGDPRQSIYHFRNADLRVFKEIMFDFDKVGGEKRVLDLSRRSTPAVLSFTNRLFAALTAEPPESIEDDETFSIEGVEYNLRPLRPDHDGGGVVLLDSEDAGVPPDAAGARRLEAQLIAACISQMVDSVRAGYRTDEQRPLRYGDIGILTPRNEDIRLLEEVLAGAGVPCASEGSRIFLTRIEIKTLSALLSALYHPDDPVSVFSALKCPAFNTGDDEIFLARAAGWDFSLNSELPQDAGEDLAAAVEYLTAFLPLARQALPSLLAEALVEQGGLGEFYARLDPTGSRLWGIEAALEVLRQEEQAGTDISTLLERLASPDPQTASPPDPPGDIPAVHIMTIHAAKGLQWPCVFPFNLGQGVSNRLKQTHVIAKGPLIEYSLATGLKIGGTTLRIGTPGFAVAKTVDDAYLSAEWFRRLYVAFTRAEDFLVLPLTTMRRHELKSARGKDKNILHLLGKIRSAADEAGAARMSVSPVKEDARTIENTLEDLRNTPETTIKAPSPRQAPDPSPFETEAVETGNLFHKVMQRYVDSRGSKAVFDRALADLPSALQSDLRRLIANALGTGLPATAVSCKCALTEYPVWTSTGMVRADLLFQEGDDWTVVDYKTEPLEGALATHAAKHRDQITGYAEALRKQGYQVGKAILLMADNGGVFDYLETGADNF